MMSRRFWLDAERYLLGKVYADLPTQVIAQAFGREPKAIYQQANGKGLRKSKQYLASANSGRVNGQNPNSIAHRFQVGIVPRNKGLRRPGYAPGRMAETQFRKGERRGAAAENWRPIGTIRIDHEGFLRVKVREAFPGEAYGFGNTKVWPLLNRHVWEQAKGPIPKGHIVAFIDHDRANCDIDNLELISQADNMRRNSVHRLPKELAEVIQLKGALKRKIRNIEKERHGKEQDSGLTRPSL